MLALRPPASPLTMPARCPMSAHRFPEYCQVPPTSELPEKSSFLWGILLPRPSSPFLSQANSDLSFLFQLSPLSLHCIPDPKNRKPCNSWAQQPPAHCLHRLCDECRQGRRRLSRHRRQSVTAELKPWGTHLLYLQPRAAPQPHGGPPRRGASDSVGISSTHHSEYTQ